MENIDIDKFCRKSFILVLDILRYIDHLESINKKTMANLLLKSAIDFGGQVYALNYSQQSKNFEYSFRRSINAGVRTKYILQLCKYSETYPNSSEIINNLEELLTTEIIYNN